VLGLDFQCSWGGLFKNWRYLPLLSVTYRYEALRRPGEAVGRRLWREARHLGFGVSPVFHRIFRFGRMLVRGWRDVSHICVLLYKVIENAKNPAGRKGFSVGNVMHKFLRF
jgi:hypothetical protein